MHALRVEVVREGKLKLVLFQRRDQFAPRGEKERPKHVEERIHEVSRASFALGEKRFDAVPGVVPAPRLVIEFDSLATLPANSAVDAESFGCIEGCLVQLECSCDAALREDVRGEIAVSANHPLGEPDLTGELDAALEVRLVLRIADMRAGHGAV